jgi:chemotaxis protein CheX
MILDDGFIRELTQVVWTTMLGLEAGEGAAADAPADEVTTSIDISGAWDGTLSLSLPPSLARVVTSAMLSLPESEATPAVVQDVVGELANVLGGNVKAVLPEPCKLSLPRVGAAGPREHGPTVVQRVWFDCVGQPFNVTVWSRATDSRGES